MKYELNLLNRYLGKAKEGQRVNFILCDGSDQFPPLTIVEIDETVEDDGEEVLTFYLQPLHIVPKDIQ